MRIKKLLVYGVMIFFILILLLTVPAQAHKVKDTVPPGGSVHFYFTDNNGQKIPPGFNVHNLGNTPQKIFFRTDHPNFPQFATASDWHQTVKYANGKSKVYSGNIKQESPWTLHPLNELPVVTWRIPDLAPASGGDTSSTIYAAVNLDVYFNANPTGFLDGNWSIGQTLDDLGYAITNGEGEDGVQGVYWTTAPIFFDATSSGPGFATANGLLGPDNPDMLNSITYPSGILIVSEHDNEDEGCEWDIVSDTTIYVPCEGIIPTLTEWGLIIFGVVLLGFITWVFLKKRKVIGVRV